MSINIDSMNWRLRASGIPYKLVDGFPRGSIDVAAGQVEEQYIIKAANLVPFLNISFPQGIALDEAYQMLPNRRYPGSSAFTTRSVTWEGFPDGLPCDPYGVDPRAPSGTYTEYLKLSITYVTGPQQEDETDPITLLEVSSDSAGEFITASQNGKATWETDGKVVSAALMPASIFVPETQWSVRWPNVNRTFLPTVITAMRNRMGKVNLNHMPLLHGAEEETVLFIGYSVQQDFTWREGWENTPVTIDMKFLEKHVKDDAGVRGHNHFWREDTGKFEVLKFADGKKAFRSIDLNTMFPPNVTSGV